MAELTKTEIDKTEVLSVYRWLDADNINPFEALEYNPEDKGLYTVKIVKDDEHKCYRQVLSTKVGEAVSELNKRGQWIERHHYDGYFRMLDNRVYKVELYDTSRNGRNKPFKLEAAWAKQNYNRHLQPTGLVRVYGFDSEDTPCGYEETFTPKRWEIAYTTMGDVMMGDNKYGLLMKNGKPTLGPNKGYWTVVFWEEAKKKFNIVE